MKIEVVGVKQACPESPLFFLVDKTPNWFERVVLGMDCERRSYIKSQSSYTDVITGEMLELWSETKSVIDKYRLSKVGGND